MVAPLLPFLPAAVDGQPLHYRVIFMQRPMPEIIASQAAMLARLGKAGASADIARAYRQQTLAAHAWLQRLAAAGQLAGLDLDYRALVAAPETHAGRTAGFIQRSDTAPAMAAAVDGALYRIRKDSTPTPARAGPGRHRLAHRRRAVTHTNPST